MKITKKIENNIAKLVKLLNDKDVINLFVYSGNYEGTLERLCYDLSFLNEGNDILSNINANQVINHWNERGELYDLAEKTLMSLEERSQIQLVDSYFEVTGLDATATKRNKQTMCKLLGLREFSTKEEILKELSEIL